MNRESEVDGSGSTRQVYDLAFGSEAVNLVWIQVQLQCVQELARVLDLLLPLDEPFEPDECLVFVGMSSAAALLVLPVCGDSFLGDPVHVIGSDLDFERLATLPDDG